MTDLRIAPDASHHQGHITTWPSILAYPAVAGAWCKVSEGTGFTDPEAAANLRAFKAAADRDDIDWFGGYLWPSISSPGAQVQRYMATVAPYKDDPRFRWQIDCEGGNLFDLDEIARLLVLELGAERGGVYGGAYLIGPLRNPYPAQAPHAGHLNTYFRAAYINDPPGQGRNVIPHLYAAVGPDWWQYTNGISGPNDTTRFPRTYAGWHGDSSCFWQPTAHQTYDQWLAFTTPGGGPPGGGGMALDPKTDAKVFKEMLDAVVGSPSEDYWMRFTIGQGDAAIPGREDRRYDPVKNPGGFKTPYAEAYDAMKAALAGAGTGGIPDGASVTVAGTITKA